MRIMRVWRRCRGGAVSASLSTSSHRALGCHHHREVALVVNRTVLLLEVCKPSDFEHAKSPEPYRLENQAFVAAFGT